MQRFKPSQETYAKKVLERFGMTNCQPTTCPITPNTTLQAHKGTIVDFLYSQVVGSIMYLAMDTRPDLAYSVGLVSQFASNPRGVHVKAVKRILCYLCATTNIGLTFGESNGQRVVGYVDADYAGCSLRRCLTSRYMFLYGRARLGWGSKKEECVGLSTIEANIQYFARQPRKPYDYGC